MKTLRFPIPVLAAALLAFTGAMPADADMSYHSQGLGSGVNASVVHPISETVTMVMSSSIYEAMTFNDRKHPLNGATGECFGAVEVTSGAAETGGYCTFEDVQGDRSVCRWTVTEVDENGTMFGDWKVVGGSGRWSDAEGGGSFVYLPNPQTGRFEATWSGDVILH